MSISKLPLHLAISIYILTKFVRPEFNARLWRSMASMTVVPMPEAAVDEYSDSSRAICDVRPPDDVTVVESISKAKTMNKAPKRDFRSGIRCLH